MPVAAYASVYILRVLGLVGVAGIAALAIGIAQVACLPDPDRAQLDAGPTPDAKAPGACGDGFIDSTTDGSAEECDPGQAGKDNGCSPSCRVLCAGGVIDPVTKHCYFRLPQKTTSEGDARKACKLPGHVITFVSDNEVAFLADAGFSSGFWIGLSYFGGQLGYQSDDNSSGEPGWIYPTNSAACPGCYARTGSDASAYFPPLGPDAGILPECVYAASLTEWHHSPCNITPQQDGGEAHDTLCEREPPGTRATVCNGGICITVAQTQKRYLFVPSDTSADDAKSSCEALSGNLVLFDSREEREQLAREIAKYTGDEGASFWVGLAAGANGTYTWDDGKAEAARPPLFGIDAGTPTPGARVFISLRPTDPIDIGLGHADVPQSLHTYVCEY